MPQLNNIFHFFIVFFPPDVNLPSAQSHLLFHFQIIVGDDDQWIVFVPSHSQHNHPLLSLEDTKRNTHELFTHSRNMERGKQTQETKCKQLQQLAGINYLAVHCVQLIRAFLSLVTDLG